jgi:type II secretory pathway predicted ATPase ExeA
MENLREYGLESNPFPLVPGARVTNWAGMDEVRERLEDVVRSVLATDTGLSEFVILLGSYGAGKTHALRYLSTLINEVRAEEFRSFAVYVPKIRVGSKINFLNLYSHIIQEIGGDRIRALAESLKQRVDTAADQLSLQMDRIAEREIREKDPLYFHRTVIESVPTEDRAMLRLLIELAKGDDHVLRFLFDGKPVVQNSDFSQQITTDFIAAHVLASLFRAMCLSIQGDSPAYQGVQLFFDEVEDIIEAKVTEQAELWQPLRELINRLPYNFALILSFSAEAALLEAIIPTALAERTSRMNIELPAMTVEEAKDFVRKQLEDFRPQGYVAPQPYYPFAEDAIDFVLEHIVILVPRKIFRSLRTVLERAIKREGIGPGEEIDGNLAEEIILSAGM